MHIPLIPATHSTTKLSSGPSQVAPPQSVATRGWFSFTWSHPLRSSARCVYASILRLGWPQKPEYIIGKSRADGPTKNGKSGHTSETQPTHYLSLLLRI